MESSEGGIGNTGNTEIPGPATAAKIFKQVTGYLEKEAGGGKTINFNDQQLFTQMNLDRAKMGLPQMSWTDFSTKILKK